MRAKQCADAAFKDFKTVEDFPGDSHVHHVDKADKQAKEAIAAADTATERAAKVSQYAAVAEAYKANCEDIIACTWHTEKIEEADGVVQAASNANTATKDGINRARALIRTLNNLAMARSDTDPCSRRSQRKRKRSR